MARRDTKTAYGIIAVGLIILVAALTCMLLNKKDTLCSTAARPSAVVKWPWIADDYNGAMYLAPPGHYSGSTEEPPQVVRAGGAGQWGAYFLDGSPYSPQGYPDCTREATREANPWARAYYPPARAASRLGEPTAFSPIESCMVGYDYGIYSGNSCLPYMTGGSLVDY